MVVVAKGSLYKSPGNEKENANLVSCSETTSSDRRSELPTAPVCPLGRAQPVPNQKNLR
jgi:hypothetical protein